MKEKEIIVFLDGVSRTIMGVKVADNDTTVTVENPVIVNAMPNESGQMSLQLFPCFFREVLEDQNQVMEFEYRKSEITATNITQVNKQIQMQYAMLFKAVPTTVDMDTSSDKVVDLFSEEAGNEQG
jgi:hypothetical protein